MPLAILRRSAVVAAMLALTALPAFAAEKQPFEAEAFRKAQASGAPILVDIAAPWCPTCQKQKPIIEKIAQDPRFKTLKIFQVDFDTQKDVVRQLNARSQSTLIAFSGSTETARSVGDTNPQSIETLIGSSLKK
jgi:thioredoxin 1